MRRPGDGSPFYFFQKRWGHRALPLLSFLQKFREVLLPNGGEGVGAVAAGLVGRGHDDGFAVFDAFDFAFEHAQFGRIDQIVRKVDRQQWRLDFFKIGSGIIVVRSFQRVEDVVGVHCSHRAIDGSIEDFIRAGQCWRFFLSLDGIVAHEEERFGGETQAVRLGFVFALLPFGISADVIDDHATPNAVASGNLSGQARQRHERVHEVRMHFAPEPGVHPTHRGAHHEAQMVDAQAFGEEAVLGFDHVAIAVFGKFGVKAVAGFAGFAVADAIRENQVIVSGVEELAFAEKFAGKFRAEEIAAVPGCAVEDQDGVANDSFVVTARCSQGAVMDSQIGQDFA